MITVTHKQEINWTDLELCKDAIKTAENNLKLAQIEIDIAKEELHLAHLKFDLANHIQSLKNKQK